MPLKPWHCRQRTEDSVPVFSGVGASECCVLCELIGDIGTSFYSRSFKAHLAESIRETHQKVVASMQQLCMLRPFVSLKVPHIS